MQPLRGISCCSCFKVVVVSWRHAPWLSLTDICHGPVDDVTAAQIVVQGTVRECAGRLSGR